MKISVKFAIAVALTFGLSGPSQAQQAPKAKSGAPPAQATPAPSASPAEPRPQRVASSRLGRAMH